jgi:C1A family cysteine protease
MKDFSQYQLGLIKSPEDKRDYVFSKIYKEIDLPNKYSCMDIMFPVRDQGSQGSCAAMSAAAMKEFQEIKDVGINKYFSPQFVYNLRDNKDVEGMTNRNLMKILKDKGICFESTFPYGNLKNPSKKAFDEASNFTIESYARIYTLGELKQALFIKGPCIVAVPVYNYTDKIWLKRPGDKLLGGHDMCAVGYDDDEEVIWIRNSWGHEFGLAGYTKMPYSEFDLAWEWWTAVDAQSVYPPIDPVNPEKVGCWRRFTTWLKKLFNRKS